MGKGDKRSKRGKIRLGSYGNTRRRKKAKRFVTHTSPAVSVKQAPAPTPAEVPAPKVTPAKKTASKKPAKKTAKKK